MATFQEIRTKADTILNEFWTTLKTRQDAYFVKHGKYFQLLISPESVVVDGVDSDFTLRHPSDEIRQVDVNLNFTTKVPFQIEVHEWGGPQGFGYKAIVKVQLLDGRIFIRGRDSESIDSGWNEVVNDTME